MIHKCYLFAILLLLTLLLALFFWVMRAWYVPQYNLVPISPMDLVGGPVASSRDVVVYFHVCLLQHWKDVVLELLDHMIASGLHTQMRVCYLSVLGAPAQYVELVHVLASYGPKFQIRQYSEDLSLYERYTLQLLYDDAKDNNGSPYNILYIHSKGVTRDRTTPIGRHVEQWTAFMAHFLLTEYQIATHCLETVDLVGVKYMRLPVPHFSGNFWWATSTYIATLCRKIGPKYCAPEFWNFTGNPHFVTLYQTNLNLYKVSLSPCTYVDNYTKAFKNKREAKRCPTY